MIFKKRNNDFELLPYVSQPLFGLYTNSSQYVGWEIQKFEVNKIWEKTTGNGIIIGVIDTGCDFNHEDLKDNLLQGINIVDTKKDPMDDNGHGTHVCGTICASDNKKGMVGVAPGSKVKPIKVLDKNGKGSSSNIAKGLVWAADNGCKIIVLSLGSRGYNKAVEEAVFYAKNKNCIIFCAAGNFGKSSGIIYPGKLSSTIAIGAIDENLNRTSFTCSGKELDFLSPGDNIVSCAPNNAYAVMSGTSMAAPFAAGCAALYISYYKISTQKEIIEKFKKHTIHLKDKKYTNKKEYEGYGIICPKV
jgi:subtilisin family serine protease